MAWISGAEKAEYEASVFFVKAFEIDLLGLIPLHRNPIVDLFHESLSEKFAGTMKVPILTLAENYDLRDI